MDWSPQHPPPGSPSPILSRYRCCGSDSSIGTCPDSLWSDRLVPLSAIIIDNRHHCGAAIGLSPAWRVSPVCNLNGSNLCRDTARRKRHHFVAQEWSALQSPWHAYIVKREMASLRRSLAYLATITALTQARRYPTVFSVGKLVSHVEYECQQLFTVYAFVWPMGMCIIPPFVGPVQIYPIQPSPFRLMENLRPKSRRTSWHPDQSLAFD